MAGLIPTSVRTPAAEIGVLVANLGTPVAPTADAVKPFLREFLGDPTAVRTKLPHWAWRVIVETVILPRRAPVVAEKYRAIWTEDGSPLLANSKKIAAALESKLGMPVALGMRYGEPSMARAHDNLNARGCQRILMLPLFPQASGATLGPIWNEYYRIGKRHSQLQYAYVTEYHEEPLYIEALANSAREHWQRHGRPERLLISFHGMPRSYGDSVYYAEQCRTTARLLADRLELAESEWRVCFQSRFGCGEWLGPYTADVIGQLGEMHKRIDVISPGIAADCLETLHELAVEGRELFQSTGGREYHYIGALNDRADHIEALAKVVSDEIAKAYSDGFFVRE